MKIVTSEYSGPDSDGDINFDLRVAFENKSDHDIEMAKSSVLLINKDGVAITGQQDSEEEMFIEPGETDEFDIWTPWVKSFDFSSDLTDVSAVIDASFYRCEFHKLGEFEIPDDHESPLLSEKNLDIGGMIKTSGLGIFMEKPDEDGETRLEVRLGMRNVSEVHFEKVLLKAELVDKRGSEVDESTDYASAPAHSGRLLTAGMYSLKPSRLKGCSIKLSLSIFQPIANESVTGKISKAE